MSLSASALLLLFHCLTTSGSSSPPPGGQYTADDNPVLRMFRNFASSFPPYGNPMNFIPPQAFPPGGAYYPNQYAYGGAPGGYGGPYYGQQNGMGYSGPYNPSGYGQPNPGYGNPGAGGGGGGGGSVPVLDTRLAGGQGNGQGTSVVKTADGRYASVSVQSNPDGKPVFRSQTVTGPDGESYGTAFAYSSG